MDVSISRSTASVSARVVSRRPRSVEARSPRPKTITMTVAKTSTGTTAATTSISRCRRRGNTDAALTDMRMEDSAAISTGPREAHAIGKNFSHVWRPYADWRAACAFRRYAYLARFRPRALERPDRGPGGRATTAGV